MPEFQWDQNLRRYRGANGKLISRSTAISLRDEFVDSQAQKSRDLAELLTSDKISVNDYQREMEERIRRSYMGEYMYGRGGKNMMQQSDYGRVGAIIRNQYTYLRPFLLEILAGSLSPAMIIARTIMYVASSREAFSKGQATSWGITLPEHPARNTKCGANCKCSWNIRQVNETEIHATWEMGGTSDHCEDCKDFASRYNPYVIKIE